MNRRLIIAILLILAFGAVRMPFEAQLEKDHGAAYFHGAKPDPGLRAKLTQMSFVAALSGFRALVADYYYLQAHNAWSRTEWGAMKADFDVVTTLQPRCLLFWAQASWHMAFNASVAAYENKKQPREALRLKAQREYWALGEDYLLRGIQNNPDVYDLYAALGNLYDWKMKEHCKASEAYRQAAKFKDAPVFYHRFVYYQLAQCPGHEQEAYEGLLALYKKGEDERLPSLYKWLGNLQEKLNVPADQKIYIPPVSNP